MKPFHEKGFLVLELSSKRFRTSLFQGENRGSNPRSSSKIYKVLGLGGPIKKNCRHGAMV